MDLSNLQLKLEEMGIKPEDIDEILLEAQAIESYEKLANIQDNSSLTLRRDFEMDWRKRAIIAAEIIKNGLDT